MSPRMFKKYFRNSTSKKYSWRDTVVRSGPIIKAEINTSTPRAGKIRSPRSVRKDGKSLRLRLPATRKPLRAKKLGRMKKGRGRQIPVHHGVSVERP